MIYLIGGAPRVGKSFIANSLAQQVKARIVATDDLCSRVLSATPEEERASKFPWPVFSGIASENTHTPEERVRLQIIEARSSEAEIDRVVTEAIHDPQFLVVEGVHLLPDHVRKLQEKFGRDRVHAIFVGSQDIERVLDGMAKNTNPHDWMKEANAEVQRQVAEFVVAYSGWIKAEASKNGLRYIERTEDFTHDIEEVTDLVIRVSASRIGL